MRGPFDQVTGGAGGGNNYGDDLYGDAGDAIVTNSYAYTGAQLAQAVAQAAAAAASAAQLAAARGLAQQAVINAARTAGLNAWRGVIGSTAGYNDNESGILNQAAAIASAVLRGTGVVPDQFLTGSENFQVSSVPAALQGAASSVGAVGLGALLGGSGAILIGGAVLLVILLAKR